MNKIATTDRGRQHVPALGQILFICPFTKASQNLHRAGIFVSTFTDGEVEAGELAGHAQVHMTRKGGART